MVVRYKPDRYDSNPPMTVVGERLRWRGEIAVSCAILEEGKVPPYADKVVARPALVPASGRRFIDAFFGLLRGLAVVSQLTPLRDIEDLLPLSSAVHSNTFATHVIHELSFGLSFIVFGWMWSRRLHRAPCRSFVPAGRRSTSSAAPNMTRRWTLTCRQPQANVSPTFSNR